MISRFFIDRPVFSMVLAIVITLAGAVALLNLPVARYPDIMPPQINVTATYPGASAEVISENVAAPIELQVNGADNMMYMFSTSSNTGNMTLSVLFNVGTNVKLAQVDVQNRINKFARIVDLALAHFGFKQINKRYFDTLLVETDKATLEKIRTEALKR